MRKQIRSHPVSSLKNQRHSSRFIPAMLRTGAVIIVWFFCLAAGPAAATIFSEDGFNLTTAELYNLTNSTHPEGNNSPVVFFNDPGCNACIAVHQYLETYLSDHPDTKIEIVNLSDGSEGEELMNELYIAHHCEWMNIPVMFFGPVGLEGKDEIINGFEGVYSWYVKPE